MAERPVVEFDAVRVQFGGNVAVDDVSFSVVGGSILGLVGPNGAGKTTLFNALSGLVRVSGGRIMYDGPAGVVDLRRIGAHRRARLGIGRTFQDSRLIDRLPVVDQLLTGAYAADRALRDAGGALLRTPGFVRGERAKARRATEVMEALGLADRANTRVDLLPAPERRLVDLGRAVMMHPLVLLLDEISAGMPADQRELIAGFVAREAHATGTTVIFVEHDMAFVRRIAQRVVVMTTGRVLADGAPDEVLRREDVLEAYIGPGAAGALA